MSYRFPPINCILFLYYSLTSHSQLAHNFDEGAQLKITPMYPSFDDLHIRNHITNSEHQAFWQKILFFNAYPEHGIQFSSAFDNNQISDICISHEENEVIESYVAGSWEYINKYLAGKEISGEIPHLERKNTLTNIVNKMPTLKIDFYRAVRTYDKDFFTPLIDRLSQGLIAGGTIMINKLFLSFTSNPYALKAFAGDTIQGEVENNCVVYKLTGGVKSISKISPVDEFEGIIPPETLFEVKHVNKLDIKIKSGQVRNIWFIELQRALPLSMPHVDFYGNPI